MQALFDVDEVYTLEQRIHHDEGNEVSVVMKNSKKRKKLRTKSQVENQQPSEIVDVISDSLSAFMSPAGNGNSADLDLCGGKELSRISTVGNSSQECPVDQLLTCNQSGKESTTSCKRERSLIHTSDKDVAFSDCSINDPSLEVTDDDSFRTSAQSLSIALRASASGVDDNVLSVAGVRRTQQCETVLGESHCILGTIVESVSSPSSNAELVKEKRSNETQDENLTDADDIDYHAETDNCHKRPSEVTDVDCCSFSNVIKTVTSADIPPFNGDVLDKQEKSLQFERNQSHLLSDVADVFKDNKKVDCDVSKPLETARLTTVKGESIEKSDRERSCHLQKSNGDEKSSLETKAQMHEIDCKDRCQLSGPKSDRSFNTDITANFLSFSIVSAKKDASISPEEKLGLESIAFVNDKKQTSKKASRGSRDHADLPHDDVMDHPVFRSLELCGGIKSNVSSFAVCLEPADNISNETGKGPDSLLKQTISTQCPRVNEDSEEVVSITEECTLSTHSLFSCEEEIDENGLRNRKFGGENVEHSSSVTSKSENKRQDNFQSGTAPHMLEITKKPSEVAETSSESKKDETSFKGGDLEKPSTDSFTCVNKDQDIVSSPTEKETTPSFDSIVTTPGKMTDLKDESVTLFSLRKGVSINPKEQIVSDEISFSDKSKEGNCENINAEPGTGDKTTDQKPFTMDNKSKTFREDNQKEDGEISSGEDDTRPVENIKREDKEEGELSSSESDAETSAVIQCDATKYNAVQSNSKLKMKDERLLPSGRNSSGDVPNKFSKDRTSMSESVNSRSKDCSFGVQNADLRVMLREARKKRVSSSGKSIRSKETKNVRFQSEAEKAVKNNGNVNKHCLNRSPIEGQRREKVESAQTLRNLKQSTRGQGNKLSGNFKERGSFNKESFGGKGTRNSLGEATENRNNSSQDNKMRLERSQPKLKIGDRKRGPSPRETDNREHPSKSEPQQESRRKQPEKGKSLGHAAVNKRTKKGTQHSRAVTHSQATVNVHHQKATGNKTARRGSKTTGETTGETSVTPLSINNLVISVRKGNERKREKEKEKGKKGKAASHSQHGKEQSKIVNSSRGKNGANITGSADVGDRDLSGKIEAAQSKKIPRVPARNARTKSPVGSKVRSKPYNSDKTRLENPRKRNRSAESAEPRQSKKLRTDKKSDSKVTTDNEIPQLPIKSVKYDNIKINETFCSKVKDSGNKMVGDKLEGIKNSVKNGELNDHDKRSSDTNSIRAKPILFGRNKCLIFKRRHVNQLFVRGDNVVMVAYAQ